METAELIEIISRGEDSWHQFKADFTNADALAAEMVAFSNGAGGRIFVGVTDANTVVGFFADAIARINQLISNSASQNVRPAINPLTENVPHPSGTVLVITVPEGVSKPYMDRNGAIWVKSGADKRRAISREEIQRLFQQSALVHADETPVTSLGAGEVDLPYFEAFFKNQFGETLAEHNIPLPRLLGNMNLTNGEFLNVAGALVFAKSPQYRLPAFIVKAVAFPGEEMETDRYIDSRDITGKLADVFQQTMGFLISNTGTAQNGQTVNSLGEPEVPRIVWEELLANALIHRDYFIVSLRQGCAAGRTGNFSAGAGPAAGVSG